MYSSALHRHSCGYDPKFNKKQGHSVIRAKHLTPYYSRAVREEERESRVKEAAILTLASPVGNEYYSLRSPT